MPTFKRTPTEAAKLNEWTDPTTIPVSQTIQISDFRSARISQDLCGEGGTITGRSIVIRLDDDANVLVVKHEDWAMFHKDLHTTQITA